MIIITNKTEAQLGPYNGVSIPASSSVNIVGAVAPYITDGLLLADIIADKVSVSFAGRETFSSNAAALMMQLGQVYNTDSDGANLSRVKQAPAGWTYQLRGFEFITASSGSLINKNHTNADLADITEKFYDADGTQLTNQSDIDSSCVKTVIDFEPTFDYYLIGGLAKTLTVPTNDVRLSVVGVPDYAAPNGSKVMIQNINMRYVAVGDKIQADGRASKGLLYNNPVPHSNKIRIVIFHTAGDKVSFCIALEMYKV